jgi:hypothetical protein
MSYRHSVYIESTANIKLADLAVEAGAVLAGLSYVPRVHFFREDPAGRYRRAVRCAGFVDYRTRENDLDVFVRGGLSPAETTGTIFHECGHIAQFKAGKMQTLTREESEAGARQLELMAPLGGTYSEVYAELAHRMTKWFIHTRDYERAKKYHRELQSVDPEAAAQLADDVLTPHERRLKISMEAEQVRREVERKVWLDAKIREFKRWCAEQERKTAW